MRRLKACTDGYLAGRTKYFLLGPENIFVNYMFFFHLFEYGCQGLGQVGIFFVEIGVKGQGCHGARIVDIFIFEFFLLEYVVNGA